MWFVRDKGAREDQPYLCSSETEESLNSSLCTLGHVIYTTQSFPGGAVVKNLPANAGGTNSIPGSGRSPEEEMTTHSSILSWNIAWKDEPGRLQPVGPQRVRPEHNTTYST